MKAYSVLLTGLAADKKVHYLQRGVGHYGVFNGSRFRAEVAPRIADFMLTLARPAPPVRAREASLAAARLILPWPAAGYPPIQKLGRIFFLTGAFSKHS